MAVGEIQPMAIGETVDNLANGKWMGIVQHSPQFRFTEIEKQDSTDSDDSHHSKAGRYSRFEK